MPATLRFIGAAVILLTVIHISATVNAPSKRIERVCGSIDIRNQVELFAALENCTIIEGHLQIRLIEFSAGEDFELLSFPELREITDYILLYRVYGMRSLTNLFPNLSVIRGQSLFYNYALVVFEMPDLEELGLKSLTRIVRGAVRIEKNPQLCYIDTIDWSALGINKDENFILQNKDVNECFNICPKDVNGRDKCRTDRMMSDTDDEYDQAFCWNADHCQSACSGKCGKLPCFKSETGSELQCCHPECVGGCTGPSYTDCVACENVFFDGGCLARCPRGTYKYHNRRCLTESECRKLNFAKSDKPVQRWKLLDNECALECPSGYMENTSDPHRCEQCRGRCPKVCSNLVIDSVASAQKAKGCTYINGAVEIQIRGGNQISSELEENLGMIEIVQDYVKIVRSHAILSFNFFKNLRMIGGTRLYDVKYSLYVLDNQNLQDTWDLEKHRNLTIANGYMFFHFNRKLCVHKILELAEVVGSGRGAIIDTNDQTTNGDLVPCLISTVTLIVFHVESTFALIRWSSFNTSDEREVLSWVIYYRETNNENVTIFDSRDACGNNDPWKTIDHNPESESMDNGYTADLLYHLKPFTKYAVYVQTYTIMTAHRGARSSINYFVTNPDTPSPVRDLSVETKFPGELHVSWKPPALPNGNITHYYIYWQPQQLAAHKFSQRNYCQDKLRLVTKSKSTEVADSVTNNRSIASNKSVDWGQCCQCPKSKEQMHVEDEERRFQIEFENFLHDSVYRKQPSKKQDDVVSRKRRMAVRYLTKHSRKKRAIAERLGVVNALPRKRRRLRIKRFSEEHEEYDLSSLALSKYSQLLNNASDNGNSTWSTLSDADNIPTEPYEATIVYDKTDFILTNLKAFQEYSIEVIACHEFRDVKSEAKQSEEARLCSNRAIITARTLPSSHGDIIDPRNITIDIVYGKEGVVSPQVWIKWKDPPSPNGLVVLYDIELLRVDVPFYKPEPYCIPHNQFTEYGGYVAENLAPGNWSFRLRVTSLAGNGSWTEFQYFVITQNDGTNIAVIISVVVIVVFLTTTVVVLGILWFLKKRHDKQMEADELMAISRNPNYADPEQTYMPDEWEVPREKIKKIRELGKGSFGMVFEGYAQDLSEDQPRIKVAIKTVGEKASYRDIVMFLNEASVMKQFKCHHVVQLLGIVSKGRPPLVIMELMANGDLKNFLRSHRPDEESSHRRNQSDLTLRQTLQMAGEIADGMAYLTHRKFVHRDLAARNCMVAEDLTVKIGDFGMTRDIYEKEYYRNGAHALLPVRWMAPEALKDGTFSAETDIWSYGVVLWEMATLAAMPYQGLSNEEVLKFVTEGGRMPRPEDCPDRIFDLMDRCWQLKPVRRPTFAQILGELANDMSDKFRELSFFFNPYPVVDSANDVMEVAADDELKVDHSTSLLHGDQRLSENVPSFSSNNHRLSPQKSAADRLTCGPKEANHISNNIADHCVAGVSDRLVEGQGDVETMKLPATSPYAETQKNAAGKGRLTNGHIPNHSTKLSEGIVVGARTSNC